MCFVKKFIIFFYCDWIVRFIIDFLPWNKINESFQNKALENGKNTSETRVTKSADFKARSSHNCCLCGGGTDVRLVRDDYIANGISKSQRKSPEVCYNCRNSPNSLFSILKVKHIKSTARFFFWRKSCSFICVLSICFIIFYCDWIVEYLDHMTS